MESWKDWWASWKESWSDWWYYLPEGGHFICISFLVIVIIGLIMVIIGDAIYPV